MLVIHTHVLPFTYMNSICRNINHILSLVLAKSVLKSAHCDEQLEEVVLASLTSRPDQLHRYLAMLSDTVFSAKHTDSSLGAANHVVKVRGTSAYTV